MRSHHILHSLALFGSASTLICCALPALFVALGAGAVLAGVVSTVPQLVWLSEHKVGLFIFAGIMLGLSGTARYLTRNAPCPADPAKAKACARTRRVSFVVFCASVSLYAIGFFFAFLAKYLLA
jgi:hypothetical protein